MEMVKLEPHKLPDVAGSVQALDNQWVPRAMLEDMLTNGLELADVAERRNAAVKGEFNRALVNLESVVVNRASLVNDPVVNGYCRPAHPERADFLALLNTETIVPFLLEEAGPSVDRTVYASDDARISAWNTLCGEADRLACLRISWDDGENKREVQTKLRRHFHERVIGLQSVDHVALAAELGFPEGSGEALRRHFYDVGNSFALTFRDHGRYGTREEIYNAFVVAGGKDAHLGRYDSGKPLVRAVKECVDLIYNTNLPDAIGRYPLTPVGSPNRMVLQELTSAAKDREIDPQQVTDLLKNAAFSLAQEGLFLDGYGRLTLGDVGKLRQREEWRRYIDAMGRVLNDPAAFGGPEGLAAVYREYTEVARAATGLLTERRRDAFTENWRPLVKVVLEIAGQTAVELIWRDDEVLHVAGHIASEFVAEKGAPFVARLVIGGWDTLTGGGKEQQDFSTSMVFWNGRMSHATEQFAEILAYVNESGKFTDSRRAASHDGNAGMDQQG